MYEKCGLRNQRKSPQPGQDRKSSFTIQGCKKIAFDILMGNEINRTLQVIKQEAIEETAVCLTCHRRYTVSKLQKQNLFIHNGEITQFCDRIVRYSSMIHSMKIIHGICHNKCLYEGKEQFSSLPLKIICKTSNESVIEFIGSVAELHTKPQKNCNFKKFETELMLDWNGPTVPKSQSFIEKSLDRHFGSRKNWRFKSGSSKYFVSQVVDRVSSQPSRLSFME